LPSGTGGSFAQRQNVPVRETALDRLLLGGKTFRIPRKDPAFAASESFL